MSDEYGCADSLTKLAYITVNKPVASFTVNDSASSCTPFEVVFTNTSQYYNSSMWNLGGGTSTLASPTQFYTLPGVYQTYLAITSPGGCVDTARKTITVFDTTGAKISYLPLNGCLPLSVDLNAYTPANNLTYIWDFGDGVIVKNQVTDINHVYNGFGDFVPKIILTDSSGCIIPVVGSDTIRIIGAIAKFGYDKKFFCDSGYVLFTDSTTFNDPIVSYNWTFSNGTTSSVRDSISLGFLSPGLYSAQLTVRTERGCTDTSTLTDIVKVVASPLIDIAGRREICINDTLLSRGVFVRPDTSVVQWSWRFPNGSTSTLQNPPFQKYTVAGTFPLTASAVNSSGCVNTDTVSLLVNPLPVITVPSPLTKFVGTPLTIPATYTNSIVSYLWTPGATLNCTDCPQPFTTTKFNTKYTVLVTDTNACVNRAEVEVIVLCKGNKIFLPNTFSPNGDGTNDKFYARGTGLDRIKSLRIFNRWGEIVYEQRDFPVNNATYGWDGTYKGKKALPDVYIYQVEIFCENSELIRFEGNISLIQ
jgi:gliding motility-associated-like protein